MVASWIIVRRGRRLRAALACLPEWTVFDLRVLPVEALADHRAVVLRGVPS